jgi:hypothetical protein
VLNPSDAPHAQRRAERIGGHPFLLLSLPGLTRQSSFWVGMFLDRRVKPGDDKEWAPEEEHHLQRRARNERCTPCPAGRHA